MRKQLRPFYTPEQLAQVYDHTYDHSLWADHRERIAKTINVLDWFAAEQDAKSVADLSCGDGAIVYGSTHEWDLRVMGDYTSTGPIEETILDCPHVDMFLLSETLEHVEDPDNLLRMIRVVADNLVLTTPHGEWTSENPEHYWGWDKEALEEMLVEAGWRPKSCELFTPESVKYYTFQMWTCT